MSTDYLLVAAVKSGCKLKAAAALAGGASIHCRDKDARTILEVAEHYRHPHLVGFLVHFGAEKTHFTGRQKSTLVPAPKDMSVLKVDLGSLSGSKTILAPPA